MVATVIELPDDLQRRIEELSVLTGRAKRDLLLDAVAAFVEAQRVPQPASDGTIDDPDLAAPDIDDWLRVMLDPASPGGTL